MIFGPVGWQASGIEEIGCWVEATTYWSVFLEDLLRCEYGHGCESAEADYVHVRCSCCSEYHWDSVQGQPAY